MKIKHCQWCDTTFEATVSYQIYCSANCRELATREKISARYAKTRRKNRSGKDRRCASCSVSLSIYNDENLCENCLINPNDVSKAIKDIKGLANGKD